MRTADILLQDFDIEISNTRRTLERVPEGKNDWVPHTKSMPFGKLATHCATLALFGLTILEEDGMDLAAPKRPFPTLEFTTAEAVLKKFDEAAAQCRAALAAASDEHLAQPWKFSFGEHVIANVPRSLAFRSFFFNHMIHHVGQLGVYLRLNDIPVPGIYGPSADEPFVPKN